MEQYIIIQIFEYGMNNFKMIVFCFSQCFVKVMGLVFNAPVNYISAISWWSVVLMEETGVPRENHRPVTSHLTSPWALVVIDTDCIGSCKSNYHTITTAQSVFVLFSCLSFSDIWLFITSSGSSLLYCFFSEKNVEETEGVIRDRNNELFYF